MALTLLVKEMHFLCYIRCALRVLFSYTILTFIQALSDLNKLFILLYFFHILYLRSLRLKIMKFFTMNFCKLISDIISCIFNLLLKSSKVYFWQEEKIKIYL